MAVMPAVDEQRNPRQPVPRDDEARAIAEDINQQRPHWLVVWGTYSRQFVAFPLFAMRQRMILTARYPDALTARLDAAEQRFCSPTGQQEGNDRP